MNQLQVILVLFLTILFYNQTTNAYADFISYSYKTCITCHFNSQGGGALTDYGRALFATEIAARTFVSAKTSDEALGQSSGFLGSTKIPLGLKPGIKFRGLYFVSSPGSQNSVQRYLTMQLDGSLGLAIDKKAKHFVMATVGYLPRSATQRSVKPTSSIISREYYYRYQPDRNNLIYFGLMDKAFGIRIVDHTAYNRANLGLAQNDQTHGVMYHRIFSPHELTVHLFTGNLVQEEAPNRQKGLSALYEIDYSEDSKGGLSVLHSSNQFVTKNFLALHNKSRLTKGVSFLSELGFYQETPRASSPLGTGSYLLLESTMLLTRGYNVFSQLEYYNSTGTTKTDDFTRWSFGFLVFPAQRFEGRLQAVTGRRFSDTQVNNDQWNVQAQLHLSL